MPAITPLTCRVVTHQMTAELEEDVPEVYYGKIMRELAVSNHGLWTLKSGSDE